MKSRCVFIEINFSWEISNHTPTLVYYTSISYTQIGIYCNFTTNSETNKKIKAPGLLILPYNIDCSVRENFVLDHFFVMIIVPKSI